MTDPVLTLFTMPAQHCPERANDAGLQPLQRRDWLRFEQFLGSLRSRVHCSFTAEENKNTRTYGSIEVENQKSMVFASISYQQNEHSFREYVAAFH
jgi:hypothetical protein